MEPSSSIISLSYSAEEGETSLSAAAAAAGLPESDSTSEADDDMDFHSGTGAVKPVSIPHGEIVSAHSRTNPKQPPVSHIFVCYGKEESWPETGPIVGDNSFPGRLSVALRSAELTQEVHLSLFDPGDSGFVEGDTILFPVRKCYRSVDLNDVKSFIDVAVVKGESWYGEQKALTGSFFFMCCHDHGDGLRVCSVCGPASLKFLSREIEMQGLQDRAQCYACTAMSETSGELVLFKADHDNGHEAMYSYSQMYPGHLRLLLSDLFGDGMLPMTTTAPFFDMWTLLLQFLHTGAFMRANIFAIPMRLDANYMPVKILKEQLVRMYVRKLVDLSLRLRSTAATCHPSELTFHWVDVTRREMQLVAKRIYGDARSFRQRVAVKAKVQPSLSVIAPTEMINRSLHQATEHIDFMIRNGEYLSDFHILHLGGSCSKPFPKGKDLLKPIYGIRIREDED